MTVPVVVLVRFGTKPGALLSDLRFSASCLGFGAVGSRSTFLIYKKTSELKTSILCGKILYKVNS